MSRTDNKSRSATHRGMKIARWAAVPTLWVLVLGTATGASAQSQNASCVAQFVDAFQPPGQTQREAKESRFGQEVSSVARFPRENCIDYF